jgi:anion-transporting  ArsA/GET3 family ATPase
MAERPEMLAEMRYFLLGAEGSAGTVALSSEKKSKVSTHGQGGVGKTTMACAVVRDVAVRSAFERIAWVSVGQTPEVMELQRVLYYQLTAQPLAVKGGANAVTQLQDLQAVCIGQCWLVVLDDVWEKEHEQHLSCVDAASASKLLVTTRIRCSVYSV